MPVFALTQRNVANPLNSRVVNLEAPSRAIAKLDAEVRWKTWQTTGLTELDKKPLFYEKTRLRPLKGMPLVEFCRSMSYMLSAGNAVEDALTYYAEGIEDQDKQLARILRQISSKIIDGEKPAAAFEQCGRFDSIFCGFIRAGNESSAMASAFTAIADRAEAVMRFRGKLMVSILPFGGVVFLQFLFIMAQCFLIPQIEKMITGTQQAPDPITAFIFGVSHFVQTFWPILILGEIALAIIVIASPKLRLALLELFMKRWKLLRKLVNGLRQHSVFSSLDMLVNNGIQIQNALLTTAKIVEKSPMETGLLSIRSEFNGGENLSKAFKNTGLFDPIVPHMIKIGEASASVPKQITRLAQLYKDQTTDSMDKFSKLIAMGSIALAVGMVVFVFAGVEIPIILLGPRLMKAFM